MISWPAWRATSISTRGGCYYYTTPNQDSLTISYIGVPEFSNVPATSHTFQIILSRPDSTVTFQYGEQIGDFTNGGRPAFSMGIENNTGTIGLSYFFNPDQTPPPDPPPFADSTVIRFIPPDSTAFVVRDLGTTSGLTAGGEGVFVWPDSSLDVWSDLKNFGNQAENNYGASVIIKQGASTVYTDSLYGVAPIDPSEVVNFAFVDPFVPAGSGLYVATFGAHLPPGADLVPENDDLLVEIEAVSYPGQLLYDDGTGESETSWSGDFSGYGNEFEPPVYPVKVDEAIIGLGLTAPGQLVVYILDDDGPGGGPGTILAGDTVSVNAAGSRIVDFSDRNVIIDEGKFYIGAIHMLQGTLTFLVDEDPPFSRRSWEYTGGWAPNRNLNINDFIIRAGVSTGVVGVGGDELGLPLPTSFALSQNYPNPFNPATTLAFDVPARAGTGEPVSLTVYDIRGRRIRTLIDSALEPGRHTVHWDGRNDRGERVSSGIYLYTLKAGNGSYTRKMTLLK